MLIREAARDDAAQLCGIVRRSIVELCHDDHLGDAATLEGWLSNKTAANMEAWIAAPGSFVFLAQAQDGLAGVAGFTGAGDLTLLYVAPGSRFAGVSAALLDHVEAKARALRLPRLRLTTTFTARRFFLERGYAVMEEEGDIFASGDGCELWKELEPSELASVAR
ncbi:MAG: putative acetyltransferase, family [Hyphomicrobiales bacterium]|nr:putative acetyltransferase, family [Hyphomicrobiales bacterium]